MSNFQKIKTGINVVPQAGTSVAAQGDVAYNSTSNQLEVFTTGSESVTTNSNTQALTNKQMSFSVSTDSTTTGADATLQAFTTGIVRITNGSLTSLGGVPAGNAGQMLVLENKTGNSVLVVNEDGSVGTAANRIQTGTGASVSLANNKTLILVYDGTSARWQIAGGTGSGSGGSGTGKNYLSAITTSQSATPNTGNGDFEFGSTTGWSLGGVGLTATGLPTGTPTIGSGYSGNLSISVVSSGQLAGSYSLSYSSSSATQSGDILASDAFYIDTEDQAKVLGFKFYYKVNSGASNGNFSGTSSNSFGVAVYDVTNSTWLGITGNFNIIQNSGVGIATGTFQTASNTTQLRFVIYNNIPTGGAITLYFDDFFVGPQVSVNAPAMTDWTSYTPTWGGSSSNPSIGNGSINGRWRRVGDSLSISVSITAGSTTTAGTGEYFFGLPSGLTIDSTKNLSIASSSVQIYNNTTQSEGFFVTPARNANTNVSILTEDGKSVVSATYPSSSWMATSGNNITFEVEGIPISGWSSNTSMSNDTDTRVVSLFANNSSGQTIGATHTILTNWTTKKDTHGGFNSSSGIYTVPVAGDYLVSLFFQCNATNNAEIQFNGSTYAQGISGSTSGVSVIVYGCKPGDTIAPVSGSNGLSMNSTANQNLFSINRLSGPAVVAATESVYAQYNTAAGQSNTSGSTTVVNFGTKINDTHSAVTTGGSWKFTAPVSGLYRVSATVVQAYTSSSANTTEATLYLYKNGSVYSRLASRIFDVSNNAYAAPSGSDEVKLLPGDYIDVRWFQNTGASQNLNTTATDNHISIVRVGN